MKLGARQSYAEIAPRVDRCYITDVIGLIGNNKLWKAREE
jgi:hypothetical protein